MSEKLSWKTSLLVRSKIAGLFVHTLTADEKNSCYNSENFTQPVQMQLSQKPKIFSELSIASLCSTSNAQESEKKDEPPSLRISEKIDSERRGYLIVKNVLLQNTLWQ